MFASGVLFLGLLKLAELVAGPVVWRRRAWRVYVWPGLVFALGVAMWPVMTFYTNSAVHMLAHSAWAQSLMLMGAAELGLARGKLHSPYWKLTTPLALAVSGTAFLVHEQNDWWFARSAFLHHLLGWTLVLGALITLAGFFRPRSLILQSGVAVLLIALAVMLYTDRDIAPVFGHLSPLAGVPHR
jgi:hypothetical protein